jgi:hypothetical protein
MPTSRLSGVPCVSFNFWESAIDIPLPALPVLQRIHFLDPLQGHIPIHVNHFGAEQKKNRAEPTA